MCLNPSKCPAGSELQNPEPSCLNGLELELLRCRVLEVQMLE